MRKLSYYLAVLAVMLFAAVSCVKPETKPVSLDTPSLTVKDKTSESFSVVWTSVEGADHYVYNMNDSEDTETVETEAIFSGLRPGVTYTVSVKAVSADGKSESDWGSVSVVLEESGSQEQNFNLKADVDDLTLVVETDPVDKEMPYYYEVITPEILEDDDNDWNAAFRTMLDTYAELYGSNTFETLKITGKSKKSYRLQRYGATYHVMIAGIDRELNIITEVGHVSVTTDAVEESQNVFTVEDVELTVSSIQVKITPSNNDPYSYILVDRVNVESMDAAQLREYIGSMFTVDNEPDVVTGVQEILYEKGIKPGSQYSLLVFGWNKMPNTEIHRHDVETPEATVDENMTFEMNAYVLDHQSIKVDIVPSDLQASYFYNILSQEVYDQYKGDLLQHVLDVCEQAGISVEKYMYYFASVGVVDEVVKNLEPETDYVLYALAVDIYDDDVVFYEPHVYDGKLRTGTAEEEILTFEFDAYAYGSGPKNDKIYVYIWPSNPTMPYIYHILPEADYETCMDDLTGYMTGVADNSSMSLAEYISSVMKTDWIEETITDHNFQDGIHKLFAVGVDVNGSDVRFNIPQTMDGDIEIEL